MKKTVLGTNLLLRLDGKVIAGNTSCELGQTTDFIEVCMPDSGRAKHYIPTTYGWSLSSDYLMVDAVMVDDLLDAQQANRKFDVWFYDTELQMMRSGDVYLSDIRVVGAVKSIAKVNVRFQPTGELKRWPWQKIVWSELPWTDFAASRWIDGTLENHRFVNIMPPTPDHGVQIVPFSQERPFRVRVKGNGADSVVLICKNGDLDELKRDIWNDNRLLNFYADFEVGHLEAKDGDNGGEGILMPAGEYYVLMNRLEDVEMEVMTMFAEIESE